MSREHLDRGRRRLTATEVDLGVVEQTAILVGTGFGMRTVEEAEASLEELALLADTAGAEPVAIELQRRDTPDP
ncbi:MAG: GTPase HflX, partial [Acidimicrobiia bacterium]|nr:GTPase HflX [Acidimicrobiia bacterium]